MPLGLPSASMAWRECSAWGEVAELRPSRAPRSLRTGCGEPCPLNYGHFDKLLPCNLSNRKAKSVVFALLHWSITCGDWPMSSRPCEGGHFELIEVPLFRHLSHTTLGGLPLSTLGS